MCRDYKDNTSRVCVDRFALRWCSTVAIRCWMCCRNPLGETITLSIIQLLLLLSFLCTYKLYSLEKTIGRILCIIQRVHAHLYLCNDHSSIELVVVAAAFYVYIGLRSFVRPSSFRLWVFCKYITNIAPFIIFDVFISCYLICCC